MKNKRCLFSPLLLLLLMLVKSSYALDFVASISYPVFDELTSPITGVVKTTPLLGKKYSKDDQLVVFDSSIIHSKIKHLKLSRQLKQKVIAEAERELQRAQELYEGTMLSDHELKLAEIKLLKAKSSLAEVQHKMTKAQWKKKFSKMKAPYDGFVIQSHIYAGKYVANRHIGTPILGFLKQGSVNIVLQQVTDIKVNIGAELNFEYDGSSYSAKVLAVTPDQLYCQLISLSEQLPPQGSRLKIQVK